jgi:hypothetical protein
MHVQLKAPKDIAEHGKLVRYNVGDWVNVGRQIAQQWIAADEACIPGLDKAEAIAGNLKNSGIVAIGDERHVKPMRRKYPALDVRFADQLVLPFERNLIWWTEKVRLSPNQAIIGFSRIEATRPEYSAWEIAAILFGPEASQFGTKQERNKTKEAIGDLRIPIFNAHIVWMRRTATTRRIVSAWRKELEAGANTYHAFLRSVYANPVDLCTLPIGWAGIR